MNAADALMLGAAGAVLIDWLATALLALAAVQGGLRWAHSRSLWAFSIAVTTTAGWFVLDNARGGAPIDHATAQAIGALLLIFLSLPALLWLAHLRGEQ